MVRVLGNMLKGSLSVGSNCCKSSKSDCDTDVILIEPDEDAKDEVIIERAKNKNTQVNKHPEDPAGIYKYHHVVCKTDTVKGSGLGWYVLLLQVAYTFKIAFTYPEDPYDLVFFTFCQ